MLVVCIRSYLKAALKYKFLILNTYEYHPDIQYLLEKRCEHPWLLFEAKRGPPAKKKSMGNTDWPQG
jgi:hypothetical protein